MKKKRDNFQVAQDILANCKEKPEIGGCLIWQGPVDEQGYGYIKLDGKRTRVHRLVALYGVQRSEEQIAELQKFRIDWDCGRRVCVRQGSGHMRFSKAKGEPVWESTDGLLGGYMKELGYVGNHAT